MSLNEKSALIVDYESDGDILKLYIPQPSQDRVSACVEVFRFIYKNKTEYDTDILRMDFDLIIKEASRGNDRVLLNFNAFLKECITGLKVVAPKQDMNFVDGEEFYKKLDKEEQNLIKAVIVFQYALLRYLPRKTIEKELSEFYTALTLEEYQIAYMKYIEAMEDSLESLENQKG